MKETMIDNAHHKMENTLSQIYSGGINASHIEYRELPKQTLSCAFRLIETEFRRNRENRTGMKPTYKGSSGRTRDALLGRSDRGNAKYF